MSEIHTIDGRGLACPKPAMLTFQALKKLNKGTIEVLVDANDSCENVSRLAKKSGWGVTIVGIPEGGYKIVLSK